jgi:hypothetical protein
MSTGINDQDASRLKRYSLLSLELKVVGNAKGSYIVSGLIKIDI